MNVAVTSLEDLLQEWESNLQSLARRQFVLEAFVTDLERVTRGKPFHVWNDVTWLLLLDCRDMLVIHLASWAKSVYEPGGLIGRLQANHANAFPVKRAWIGGLESRGDAVTSTYMSETHDSFYSERFNRLFACGSTCFPALRDRFANSMKGVTEDRNANRAHPYERKQSKASAAMLNIDELRRSLTFAEEFVNDLRGLANGSYFSYSDLGWTNSGRAAAELVDSILMGARLRRFARDDDRQAYYDARHEKHDALGDPTATMFNDNWPKHGAT
jgi:hypothetical protein